MAVAHMTASPDVRVARLLRTVTQRLAGQALLRAAGLGGAAAVIPFLLTRSFALAPVVVWTATIGFALAVAIVVWWRSRRTSVHAAARIEAVVPACRNVLITAHDLLTGHLDTTPIVRAVVLDDAARVADSIAPAALWPWHRVAVPAVTAAVLWLAAAFAPLPELARELARVTEAASLPAITLVDIVITPPAYAGQPIVTVRDPDRISPLAGSRVDVRVAAHATAVTLETAVGQVALTAGQDHEHAGGLVVTADGYLAVTPHGSDGREGVRRLIGVTAVPDRAPEVRITEPAKDLFLRTGATRLTVTLQAGDDIGLRGLRLAYTKVAGAGESFTFTDGDARVELTRTSDREWTAVGVLPLDTMHLDVGDMVVYRGVAIDGRPGATPVESDAFIVEIVSASEAMAEGFSIDDTQDKYALSQQMVILKTERLLARAPGMSRDAVREESMNLAAEQRSVRAEIVFMMGGEFEDEFVEAEHEHDVTDGRFDNSGRADLGLATRAMSRAATLLLDADLKTALATERAALVAMQRALSRRRFILRTLTQREPMDDSRRLQGVLRGLGRGTRQAGDATVSPRVLAARAALSVVIDVSRHTTMGPADAARLSTAAAALLTIDGRSAPLVDAASRLTTAAAAIAAQQMDEATKALMDASSRLTAIVAADLAAAPGRTSDADRARLHGALADALRRRGQR
jgi:hypothetical protein